MALAWALAFSLGIGWPAELQILKPLPLCLSTSLKRSCSVVIPVTEDVQYSNKALMSVLNLVSIFYLFYHSLYEVGVVAHTWHPNLWDTEAGGLQT